MANPLLPMNEPEHYINPFTEWGFKKLFGSETNKALLIGFLNQVVSHRAPFTQLTYAGESMKQFDLQPSDVFCIQCTNERGDVFRIELYNRYHLHFKDRSAYYAMSLLPERVSVYYIGILNFTFSTPENKTDGYRHQIQLMDTESRRVVSNDVMLIFLEMPHFTKRASQLSTKLDKWMYALKNMAILRKQPPELDRPVFDQLFREAEISRLSAPEWRNYNQDLKTYRSASHSASDR